ncbi:hypothetical protein D3C73_1291400 [compost metagenome]
MSLLTRLVMVGMASLLTSSRIARAAFQRANATRKSRLPFRDSVTNWLSVGSSNCCHQMPSNRERSKFFWPAAPSVAVVMWAGSVAGVW